jgi:hypothetical protein
MASIRVIFMGSVLSIAARVAAGSLLIPRAANEPTPVFFRKDLLLSLTVALYFNGATAAGSRRRTQLLIRRGT